MHNNNLKHLLKTPNQVLELKETPVLFESASKVQFTGEAKIFLQKAYRTGGVNADVKFITLKTNPKTGECQDISNRDLNFTALASEGETFVIAYK